MHMLGVVGSGQTPDRKGNPEPPHPLALAATAHAHLAYKPHRPRGIKQTATPPKEADGRAIYTYMRFEKHKSPTKP